MAELLFPVYEFRPLPDAFTRHRPYRPDVYRYAGGAWIPDDGEFDLAFAVASFALFVEVPYQRNLLWKWLIGPWHRSEPRHPRGNPWHRLLREDETEWGGDWGSRHHPNSVAGDKAMTKAASLGGGCANGLLIDFNLYDEHMRAGLVRERETGTVVVPPITPTCMYCGTAWLKRVAGDEVAAVSASRLIVKGGRYTAERLATERGHRLSAWADVGDEWLATCHYCGAVARVLRATGGVTGKATTERCKVPETAGRAA